MGALLIVATACTRPRPAATAEAPPVCATGGLLFSASYVPTDLALSPDGKLLAVADLGILVLRDAETLHAHRYLAPQLNYWKRVRFADAGRVLLADTVDGLHVEFDTTTWELRNPPTRPDSENFTNDTEFGMQWLLHRSKWLLGYNSEFWKRQPGLPELGPNITATAAEFSLIDETGWTAQLRDYEQDLDALTLEQVRTVVATSDGEIRILNHRGEILVRRRIPASAAIAKLEVTGGHLVAGTASGEVIVLTRELAEVGRAQVLRPGGIEDARLDYLRDTYPPARAFYNPWPDALPPDSFVRFLYDPVAQRIFWLSTSFRIGVYDFETKTSLAELPATGPIGVRRLSFLDARTLVALSSGAIWVWNIASGQTTWHAAGPFQDAVLTGEPGIITAGPDGRLTLHRRDNGEVVRSVCILPGGCDPRPAAEDAANPMSMNEYLASIEPRRIQLEPAPDRRYVLVVDEPIAEQEVLFMDARAGSFQVWSADLTERVLSIALDECPVDPLVVTGDVVQACTRKFHATTFQPIPDAEAGEPLDVQIDASLPLAHATLRITREDQLNSTDTIVFAASEAEEYVLAQTLAQDSPSPPRQWQQLHFSVPAVTADGRLFALAGGEWMRKTWLVAGPSGPVQVWCVPAPGQAVPWSLQY
jgi:hypothetical protein